jgi:hypothetical protein
LEEVEKSLFVSSSSSSSKKDSSREKEVEEEEPEEAKRRILKEYPHMPKDTRICASKLYNKIHFPKHMVEGIVGFSDMLSLAQTIGIVGTIVLTLYFSKGQIQALSIDQQTKVLNDLDEKFHNMANLAMEDPSIVRVIDAHDYTNKREVAAV